MVGGFAAGVGEALTVADEEDPGGGWGHDYGLKESTRGWGGEFLEEIEGDVGGEDGAVFVLFDLGGFDEFAKGWVGGVAGCSCDWVCWTDLKSARSAVREPIARVASASVGSDLLDAEVECAQEPEAGDECRVFGERKLQAEEADVAAIGERKADVADAPKRWKKRGRRGNGPRAVTSPEKGEAAAR